VQHAGITVERWSSIPLEQRILMIGNEMNRAAKLFAPADRTRLVACYERVLRLVDLTVECKPRRGLRRELLRWREVVAGIYQSPHPDRAAHLAAFRCLLQLDPGAATQIPFVLGKSTTSA